MSVQGSSTFTRPRVGTIVRVAAFVVVIALLVVGAIIGQGFDVRQAVVKDGSIWVLNKTAGAEQGQYARVNTDVVEIDSVKDAALPSTVVQNASDALLITKNNGALAKLDPSRPLTYPNDSTDLVNTPEDTTDVVTTGNYVGYRTGLHKMYVAAISDGVTTPTEVRPHAGEPVADGAEEKTYSSDAMAIGTDGILYSYSAAESAVFRYDIATASTLGDDPVTGGPGKDDIAGFAVVGTNWVLFDASTRSFWTKGASARSTGIADVTGLAVQQSSDADDYVYAATPTALTRIRLSDGATDPAFVKAANAGTPARPTRSGGELFAAWVVGDATTTVGILWRSSKPTEQASLDGIAVPSTPDPQFRSNGSTIVLNEAQSGLVWTDDGTLVPSSEDWKLGNESQPQSSDDAAAESEPDVPVAPKAVPDDLGVRAGQLVTLPVLLNDSDANSEDVLTIVPDSVSGLEKSFGSLSVTNNDQQVGIQVSADATGTATFSYSVSDGALQSDPAEVTLTVVDPDTNNPPLQCTSDDGCSSQVPKSLQVAPGSSSRVNILGQWYDPDGDPIYLKSAELVDASAPGVVAASPDGWLTFQDPDPNGTGGSRIVTLTVSDSLDASTPAPFTVAVTAKPTMAADSFAVTTQVGEKITVDPSPYISGAAGQFTLDSLTPPEKGDASVVANSDARTFLFSSGTEGSYTVNFSVRDSLNSIATAQARITVVPKGAASVTTSPITVFIRPKLDSTVDVLTAVSNPAGRVLLLTSAEPVKQNNRNTLVVDVIDHHLLRVKGSLAEGTAGVVGVVSYTIADGEGDSGATVVGRATVIMLESTVESPPIAVDDTIVVRAGTQVDVPVLDNDVAPDGNSVVLSSEALDYPTDRGLAFVAGSKVRILAPDHEDSYTITYSIYSAGYPDNKDSADIHVTVRSADGNSPPQPKTLEGRVFAGETVSIPFSGSGIDPDGDDVFLDRIEAQPQAGAGIAAISSSGNAIEYTAPLSFSGVAEFSYRVKDGLDSATALVRIGVISSLSDPAPVTFSDYVEATAGADSSVVVHPAANDIDPRGGTPVLQSVEPDVPATLEGGAANPEYEALKAGIQLTDDGAVRLSAGLEVGTKTFVYTVLNAAKTSPGVGYIVLKVVKSAVPDLPVVTDSYLSLDDRETFSTTGIDVVTGHVTWLSGDVTSLTLKLWGDPRGFTVTGSRISGPLADSSVLVPFELDGTSNGQPVQAFGFLKVPGKNDIILTLRAGRDDVKVAEDKATTFDMVSQVTVPSGDELVVSAAETARQRPEASCSVTGTVVTYMAGHGDPYDDACIVSVRLASQDANRVTQLVVPVQVEPTDAQPVLTTATQVARPTFAPVVFSLETMLSWKGIPDQSELDAIEFSVNPGSLSDFVVDYSSSDRSISITARGAAIEGRSETLTVAFTGKYAKQAPSTITLKVGPAPSTTPKGASVSVQCTADDPASCGATVTGVPGESSIFTDAELTVVSVQPTSSSCPGVSFSLLGSDGVGIDYAEDVDGAKCQVTFVVEDVQHNRSSGTRDGVLSLDLYGFPKPARSVAQTGYGDGTVELRIDPGAAATSYPALDHFEVDANGKTVRCPVDGRCPVIRGLTNGSPSTYVVSSWNTEDEKSLTTVQVSAYSYAKPDAGKLAVAAVFDRSLTSLTKGAVDLTITGSEASVEFFEITGVSGRVKRTEGATVQRIVLPVGDQQITVTPISKFQPPPGDGPTASNLDAPPVRVIGLPSFSAQPSSITSAPNALTVNGAKVDTNKNPAPPELLYVAYVSGAPTCTVGDSGSGVTVSGVTPAGTSASETISGLTENVDYSTVICAGNGFGVAQSGILKDATFKEPAAPVGYTFDVSAQPNSSGLFGFTGGINGPAAPTGFTVDYQNKNGMNAVIGRDPDVNVRYCQFGHADRCGAYADVVAVDATRSYQMQAVVDASGVQCVTGSPFTGPTVARTGNVGTVVADAPPAFYNGGDLLTYDGVNVPDGATKVRLGLTMTWPAEIAGLVFSKQDLSYDCTSPPAPEPTPTPTSTPGG